VDTALKQDFASAIPDGSNPTKPTFSMVRVSDKSIFTSSHTALVEITTRLQHQNVYKRQTTVLTPLLVRFAVLWTLEILRTFYMIR